MGITIKRRELGNMETLNKLHLMCNEPDICKDDVTVNVTFPIGTSYTEIAKWVKAAPLIIQLFEDRPVNPNDHIQEGD